MSALSAPQLYVPSEQQQAAITAAMLGLDSHDRGQLVMACGTGKTLTALRFAEARNAGRVLVLLPNLALLAQTLREWRQQSHTPFQAIAVCSDQTVAPAADGAAPEQTVPVTTDLTKLTALLTDNADRRMVVFATYQSGGRVAAAQAAGAPTFDLVFADESHRTAGRATAFQHVLDAQGIRARERLFLTATPRHSTDDAVASMDNHALYGPVLYSYGFGQAIEDGLLTPYQVTVMGITDNDIRSFLGEGAAFDVNGHSLDGAELAAAVAVLKTMDDHQASRMLTFHSRVDRAERFAAILPAVARWMQGEDYGAQLSTGHVNGGMSTADRAAELDALRNVAAGQRRVLTNARCLTEGIDVPAIDAVAFIDPKTSQVDIVQAIGRAIRRSPNKKVGTVLLPVYLGDGDDPEAVLASSAFATISEILTVLADQDEAFAATISAAKRAAARVATSDTAESLSAADAQPAGDQDGPFCGLARTSVSYVADGPDNDAQAAATKDSANTQPGGQHDQSGAGDAATVEADAERRALILDLPSDSGAWFHRALITRLLAPPRDRFAERLAALAGHIRAHDALPTKHTAPALERFIQTLRTLYRRDELSADKVAALEALPHWTWTPRTIPAELRDRARQLADQGESFSAIAALFVAEGVLNAEGYVSWRSSSVRKLVLGAQARETTSRAQRWTDRLAQLRAHTAAHGPLQPRTLGIDRALSGWITRQRSAYRDGTLTSEQVAQLESVPGWTWHSTPDRAELQQRAQALFRAGASLTDIADQFTAEGLLNANGKAVWASSSIRKLVFPADARVTVMSREQRWADKLAQLLAYTAAHGPLQARNGGMDTGLTSWVRNQRVAYNDNDLTAEQIDQLDAVPAWTWTSATSGMKAA
jgi:superfamily II DNA or RNA helicase